MMASDTVPAAMSAAFERADGDLAERLMTALDAAEGEGGDVRGRQSAALIVVPADGEPWQMRVQLRVEDHDEPLRELRRLLVLQRAYEMAGQADELLASERARRRRRRSTGAPPSWRRTPTSCCSGPASRWPRPATSRPGVDAVRRAIDEPRGLGRAARPPARPTFAPAGAGGPARRWGAPD